MAGCLPGKEIKTSPTCNIPDLTWPTNEVRPALVLDFEELVTQNSAQSDGTSDVKPDASSCRFNPIYVIKKV